MVIVQFMISQFVVTIIYGYAIYGFHIIYGHYQFIVTKYLLFLRALVPLLHTDTGIYIY